VLGGCCKQVWGGWQESYGVSAGSGPGVACQPPATGGRALKQRGGGCTRRDRTTQPRSCGPEAGVLELRSSVRQAEETRCPYQCGAEVAHYGPGALLQMDTAQLDEILSRSQIAAWRSQPCYGWSVPD